MSQSVGPLAAFAHAQQQQKKAKKQGRPRKVPPPIVMPSAKPQPSKRKSPPRASSLPVEAPIVNPAPIEDPVKADASLSDESDSANTSMDESSSGASTTDGDYSPPGDSVKKLLNKEGAKELLKAKLMTRAEKSKKRPPAVKKVEGKVKRVRVGSPYNKLAIPGEPVFIPVNDKFVLMTLCKKCMAESLSKVKLLGSGRQFITFVLCAQCVGKNKFLHSNIPSQLKF